MNRFLFACLFVVAIGCAHADEPERIVGGETAAQGEFPYTISIRVNGYHFCGGAIIGPRHILTAAHCLQPLKGRGYNNVFVVTGTNSIQSGGQSHRVVDMFYHQGYNPNGVNWYNDIGVIKLAAPINYNNAQRAISLPSGPLPKNANVVVSGWGLTAAAPRGKTPTLLQKILLKTLTTQQCQSYFSDIKIYDHMVCTFKNVNFGTCNGDSGGPLAFGNEIHGVVSGGIPCARGMPDVFTNVHAHLPFVRQAMTY